MSSLAGIFTLLCLCAGIWAQDSSSEDNCNFNFGYSGENGPETWGDYCPECNGQSQSPINIDTSQAQILYLPALDGSFLQKINEKYYFRVRNDGYTATVYLQTPEPLTIEGGPLDGTYTLRELQFCWGSNDSVGSEHTFNGERFPMEAEWVFENNDQELRIVQLYKLSDESNTALSLIAGMLGSVIEPGSEAQSSDPISYDSIFSGYPPDDFYAYSGSLTTPPCTEGITWLVYPPGLPYHEVTEDVLEKFRNLKSSDGGPLVDNFRPLQPLNGRQVVQSLRSSQFHNHSGRHHGHGGYHREHQTRTKGHGVARHRTARRHP